MTNLQVELSLACIISQSVLRKAAEAGIVIPEIIPAGLELSAKEEGLIQMLADFKSVVKQAGSDYNPSIIANYAYDLVKEYNQFYHDFSILREENEALKKENEKQRQLIEKLEMDKDFLQMARQIAPDREALDRSRAMIARLVRDVDKCIEQLKD